MAVQVIRAAGAVLWRPAADGIELALVHRTQRKDWSFPKGKLEPGEHPAVAAVREVAEETGYAIALGRPLPSRRYHVDGLPKHVRYWAARADKTQALQAEPAGSAGSFEEIDELRWVPDGQARELLSYKHDVELVPRLHRLPLDTVPLVVVRHGKAVKRAQWAGTVDAARPLDSRGIEQGRRLVPLLAAYGIRAVHSSDATRCRDTVLPYARSREVDVVDEPLLSEEGHAAARKASRARAAELLATPEPLVVCSHRPVLPDLLAAVDPGHVAHDERPLAPGAILVLHRVFAEDGVRVVAVERHSG
ncbi:MAG: NUDIX domain-containing protein [Actinomycetes bacterium]